MMGPAPRGVLDGSGRATRLDRRELRATRGGRSRWTVSLAIFAWALALTPGEVASQAPERDDLVLLGGTLFPATDDRATPNPGILIRNGSILRVGVSNAEAANSENVVRLQPGHFVMPGIFDLHAHYAIDLFGQGRVDEYRVNPVIFLANGVTSTFPAGEVDPAEARAGRERIVRGEVAGPRIFSSGPYYGAARPGWSAEVMTPDSVRAEVDHWAARGARSFKAKGIAAHQLRALVERAHLHGLTVTAHLGSGYRNTVNPGDAIEMGIDRIEHFLGGEALPAHRPAYASLEGLDLTDPLTLKRIDRQIARFLDHSVYFDATLTAYGYFADREPAVFTRWEDERRFLTPFAREAVESRLPRTPLDQFQRIYYVKRQTVRRFSGSGGTHLITLGTDHPSWGEYLSGFGSHRELHALVLAGIPEASALRIATINGARALGVGERLGTVEAGKYADLIVIEGNPLADITDSRNVRWVVKAGRLYEAAALLDSVRGTLGPADLSEAEWWKGNLRLGR